MNEPLSGPVVVYLGDPLPKWWTEFLFGVGDILGELSKYKIKHVNTNISSGKTMLGGAIIFPNEKTYTWFLLRWS